MATCKYCGEPNLTWDNTDSGWKLISSNGTRHICPPKEKESTPTITGDTTTKIIGNPPKELIRWYAKGGNMKLQWFSMEHKRWIDVPIYAGDQDDFASLIDEDDIPF